MSYYAKSFDDKIVGLIKDGAVGFMPSDTIYGLSCLALDKFSVERIARLKEREAHKPFIILITNIDQADQLDIEAKKLKLMENFWPAPITFVASAGKKTPKYLHKGMHSLALRVPSDDRLREFIAKIGPIVSTSVNIQGQKPIDSVAKAKKTFGELLDFYVDIGRLGGEPSTIIKQTDNKIEILRQGSYKFSTDEIGKNL